MIPAVVIAVLLGLMLGSTPVLAQSYPWRGSLTTANDTIAARFAPPAGFARVPTAPGSFGAWLRGLPLLPAGTPVKLHTGADKPRQDVHLAVVDIDIGARDLQQCADAVMRLRAEYLRAVGRTAEIAFPDTGSGAPIAWTRYAAGERPSPEGRRLTWSAGASPDTSPAAFRRYLDVVFTWAGTYSLDRDLQPVTGSAEIGDVVIKGGFPGHAVIIVDQARHPATGEMRVLYAQSFMPAQSIHVLRSAADPSTAWAPAPSADQPVATPEWAFPAGSLKRWRTTSR
jgi:hypothetical protein